MIGGGAHATAARIVGNDILWYAETDGGKRLLQLWVRLEQVGEGTRARVEIAHNSAEIAANLADHPEVERMFAALVHEQVDATLTDRAFEFANVSNEVAAALRPMQPTVEAGFRAAEASDKRARAEAIDRAYNEAARSRHQELDGTGSDFDEEAEMQGWAAGQE